ncbi:MAG: 2-C-methyl-D-erythritol 4-phosphate cytidylyltransferase [Puniceicoccales bacterium]|jgi:2-C-methyl-D-erythritol 4-phosphate cytidylyltransferase|nr:2-C-methyl-D-erythritol 4-phosphate cytidylyltransferase [Puniceicoccales bacterium]
MAVTPRIRAILLAAGRGRRLGADIPKQFLPMAGQPLLYHALLALATHGGIDSVHVVLPEDFLQISLPRHPRIAKPIVGGHCRHHSTAHAVREISPAAEEWVLVHDAARPFLPRPLVDEVCLALARHDAIAPAVPIADALIELPNLHALDRHRVRALQTPQGFRCGLLCDCFDDPAIGHCQPASEFELVQRLRPQARLGIVPGHPLNGKVTDRASWLWMEWVLRSSGEKNELFDG